VAFGIDLFPDLFDFSVGSDQETAAGKAQLIFSGHAFFDPNAKKLEPGY